MRVIKLIIITAIIHYTTAGYYSQCEIDGVSKSDWYYGVMLRMKVPDNQELSFVQFNTQRIIGIVETKSTYLSATYNNSILSLLPSESFKSFEEDYGKHGSPIIELTIKFNCTNNTFETITFQAVVEDVNDNAPIFSKEIYEYHFGMAIPEDYRLTNVLPISAIDSDFTNHDIFFTIKFNTKFRLQYRGSPKYYNDRFFATLQTLSEIKAPFWEEFTLIATDSGIPPRQSTARLIISVSSNTSRGGEYEKKPIFSKSVYLGQYSPNALQLKNPIEVRHWNSIVLRQQNLRDYFAIESRDSGAVHVSTLRPLPKSLVKSRKFVVIEMEAQNQALQSSDSAVLIVRFQDNCDDTLHRHCLKIWSLYGTTWWLLIFYTILISITLIINREILSRYFKLNKKLSISFLH